MNDLLYHTLNKNAIDFMIPPRSFLQANKQGGTRMHRPDFGSYSKISLQYLERIVNAVLM